jgi:hypothetical protein
MGCSVYPRRFGRWRVAAAGAFGCGASGGPDVLVILTDQAAYSVPRGWAAPFFNAGDGGRSSAAKLVFIDLFCPHLHDDPPHEDH